jgi:hypothetical protein
MRNGGDGGSVCVRGGGVGFEIKILKLKDL